MFNIKNILLGALAIVGFSLYTLWEHEHPNVPFQSALPTASVVSTPATISPESTAPLSSTSTAYKPIANHQMKEVSDLPSLIHIKTDVLDVLIDKKGGNIISNQLLNYPESTESNPKSFTLLNNSPKNYYAAESGLISPLGPDSATQQGLYESEKESYALSSGQAELVVPLHYKNEAGLDVEKIFTFKPGSYEIDIRYEVTNHSSKTWEGQNYWQLKRTKPESKNALLSFSTYTGAAYSTKDQSFKKIDFDDLAKQELNKVTEGGWIAMIQQYFLSAFIPNPQEDHRFYALHEADGTYSLGSLSPVYTLAPEQKMNITGKLYSGPLITPDLKKVAPHLDMTVDYGWLWYISIGLFWLLQTLHLLIGNWGWAIIALTILIKIMLYAPSSATYRAGIRMREIQPKIQSLKDQFANNKQALHEGIARLYKTEKVNPLGGCLPLLLQLPVFIGLYWVIIESVELRHAPFLWIQDLSSKDPYYILPVLMFITMYMQQKLSPPPADPMQAKVMNFMPVIFSALFINFPAGLLVYWVVNNILSIIQQWFVTRMHGYNKIKGAANDPFFKK